MIRRVFVLIAAAIAVAILAACIKPEQANAQSAAPLAAVRHCSQILAASSHRSEGQRFLSSVKISRARHMCAQVRTHVGTIRFWSKPAHRWTLYMHYQRETCWDLRRKHLLAGPEALCMVARGAVRTSTERLVKLDKRIKALLPKPHLAHDSLYALFLCIHTGRIGGLFLTHGEGSWTANTGNNYYGGLQMDLSFQSSYGADFVARWGTADHWPAWAQITAAERAYRSGRGVGPWPQTGPPCAAHLLGY